MSDSASTAATYERLVRDFCQRAGLDEIDAVAHGHTLDVDNVQLAFCLNEVIPESPVVSIYVDLGVPSPGQEAGVLRVLLQQNFHNSANRGIAYAIAPSSGHVIGVLHVGLGDLGAQGLEALVNMLVDSSLELMKSGLRCDSPRDADDHAHGV